MNQKQKMLLIGGSVIAAVVLYVGFSSAATKKVGPAPGPKPNPNPTPPPYKPVPTQAISSGPIDSPFGKFMPCVNGPAMSEPYNAQIRAAIDASFDAQALSGAADIYHANGCEDLASRAASRAQALISGGNAPGGQHVVSANLLEYGAVDSACDLSGVMVDGQRGADIEKWMMSQNDPTLLSQVATALRKAQPPCEVLAKKADAQASYLKGLYANIAAQNQKTIDDANAAAGTGKASDVGSGTGVVSDASPGYVDSAVDSVKSWF